METSTEANSHTYYYYYHMPEGDTYPDNPHDNVDWIRAGSGDHHPEVGGVEQRDVDLYHSSIHERDFTNSANVGIIITACNIVLNLLLIALVLMRRSTRLQFVYQQVVNMALSDLAFSVVVDPFSVYFDLQPWGLARGFCVAWMVLDCALPFVSFLALAGLNVDRLLFALSPDLYRRACSRLSFRAAVFLLPWTLGLGVLVPLWLFSAVIWPRHGLCMYGVTKRAAMASAVISIYLPCVALIVLTVLVIVTLIGGMPQDQTETSAAAARGPAGAARPTHVPPARQGLQFHHLPERLMRDGSLDSAGCGGVDGGGGGGGGGGDLGTERSATMKSHRRLVVTLCVLNLLTVITQLPYSAISMLEPQCVEKTCQSTIQLLQALSWMRSLTFSLHPLCLIALTPIRHACCSLCARKSGEVQDSAAGQSATAGGSAKSDRIELTPVNNTAIVRASKNKAPPTMV